MSALVLMPSLCRAYLVEAPPFLLGRSTLHVLYMCMCDGYIHRCEGTHTCQLLMYLDTMKLVLVSSDARC